MQNLVHIAVVLDEDTAFRIFRQVHPFDNVPPAFTLFRIIQVGDAAYAGIFIGILPGNDFKETESGFEATHAGVVGIPVIVYVVFVFIGSGNSQNDVFLLRLRERHPLAPEAADGYHYFQSVMGGYNDMADAKALLESIARSFGYIYGREHNVRVNTISQSPTMTTAGSGVKGMDKLFDFANRMSPLGNASADECADYCIVMFSDLTRKVTMQNLFHDGGFSSVGMSLRAMATYEKGLDEYKDENGNIIYG